jgi:hypothetical protein
VSLSLERARARRPGITTLLSSRFFSFEDEDLRRSSRARSAATTRHFPPPSLSRPMVGPIGRFWIFDRRVPPRSQWMSAAVIEPEPCLGSLERETQASGCRDPPGSADDPYSASVVLPSRCTAEVNVPGVDPPISPQRVRRSPTELREKTRARRPSATSSYNGVRWNFF